MLRVSQELGPTEGSKYSIKNYTQDAFKRLNARTVTSIIQSVNSQVVNHLPLRGIKNKALVNKSHKKLPVELEYFNLTNTMEIWFAQGCLPTFVLVGDTGTGKTLFFKALAKEKGWNMLICNHLEGLKDQRPHHDAILFDDMSFKDIDDKQLLAVLSNDEAKQIRVLYGSVPKRQGRFCGLRPKTLLCKGIIQMFTLNTNAFKKIVQKIHHKEYARRILIDVLKEPLIDNLTMNDDLAKHTEIYNNPDNIKRNQEILKQLAEEETGTRKKKKKTREEKEKETETQETRTI